MNTQLANEITERIGIESELADTKTDLAEAQQSALQDALTGLPNRVSFAQGLSRGLIQAKRHDWGLAVLFIDIDQFKSINDSYGHDTGDQVLQTVANRLKSFVRDEDMVSRFVGPRSRVDRSVAFGKKVEPRSVSLLPAPPVVPDAHEPGVEASGTAEGVKLAERLQEDVLREVLGVLAPAEESTSERDDLPLVPRDRQGECVYVARTDAADDLFVVARGAREVIGGAHSAAGRRRR